MTAKYSMRGDTLHVTLYGEIDHHSVKPIRDETDIQLLKHHPHTLTLDFKNVTFMDSSGIGYIMGRYKTIKSITIVNANPHVKRVMLLSGISRIATIN
jgi:stage II sporulation protein AA (anti-sigma F factor antagonist)